MGKVILFCFAERSLFESVLAMLVIIYGKAAVQNKLVLLIFSC